LTSVHTVQLQEDKSSFMIGLTSVCCWLPRNHTQ